MNLSFTKHTLSNGLDVLLHEDHACPIVAVNLWYHVGSKNERPGPHRLRAPLRAPDVRRVRSTTTAGYFQPLQGAGASLNGSTNADRTNYWEVVPTARSSSALWMESDRMGYLLPALTEAQVREPARRRAERASAELREPAVRPGRDGAARGAVSAGSSVSLDDDRRSRPTCTPPGSTTCRRSSAATITRPTRRWRLPATSIPTRARAGARRISERFRRGEPVSRVEAPASLEHERARCCSRIASSCRACIWRGSRRRCSPRVTRTSISPPTCWPTARRRACTGAWCSTSASRPTCRRPRTRARSAAIFQIAATAAPGQTLGEIEARDPRGDRATRPIERPDRRRDGTRPRAGRSAVRLPPADGRRLRRQVRSAERLQRVRRRSRLLRARSAALSDRATGRRFSRPSVAILVRPSRRVDAQRRAAGPDRPGRCADSTPAVGRRDGQSNRSRLPEPGPSPSCRVSRRSRSRRWRTVCACGRVAPSAGAGRGVRRCSCQRARPPIRPARTASRRSPPTCSTKAAASAVCDRGARGDRASRRQLDTDIGSDAMLARFHRAAPGSPTAALALLGDIVARPRCRDDDFARVRQLRLHRLTQLRDVPSAIADRAFVALLYGEHPYGHTPIGTERSLDGRDASTTCARFHATRDSAVGARR